MRVTLLVSLTVLLIIFWAAPAVAYTVVTIRVEDRQSQGISGGNARYLRSGSHSVWQTIGTTDSEGEVVAARAKRPGTAEPIYRIAPVAAPYRLSANTSSKTNYDWLSVNSRTSSCALSRLVFLSCNIPSRTAPRISGSGFAVT